MKVRRALAVLSIASGVALTLIVVGASAERNAAGFSPIPAFTPSQSLASSGNDWISPEGDVWNQRHSTLSQITTDNVAQLKAAWHVKVGIPGVKVKMGALGAFAEASPVVYNGVMYLPDGNSNVFAFNASTGERLWYYKPHLAKLPGAPIPPRGVTIGDGKVFVAQADASVVALDQSSGRVLWHTVTGNPKLGQGYSSPGPYYDGKLYEEQTGGDGGANPFVVTLDAKTGKILWKFKIIPTKPGDPFYNTWPKKKAWEGGGAMWNTPVLDPALGLAYYGIGNPVPYNGNTRGPGKEMPTESVLALHMDTGKVAWAYQEIHHDIWDYDTTNPIILYDMTYNGQLRHALVQANKNGFLYILDRATGKPILGAPEKAVPQNPEQNTYATQPIPVGQAYAPQCPRNVYKGKKGPDGKPFAPIGCVYTPYTTESYGVFAPSPLGGTDWPPSSFDPKTGYMVMCSKESSSAWKALPADKVRLKQPGNFFQVEGLFPAKNSPALYVAGQIVAVNLLTNKVVWRRSWEGDTCYSGVTTTAGNLTFVGRNSRHIQAYETTTGRLVWTSPRLFAGADAPPVTYMVNGKQYVAVFAGGNGIASLFGSKKTYGADLYAFQLP